MFPTYVQDINICTKNNKETRNLSHPHAKFGRNSYFPPLERATLKVGNYLTIPITKPITSFLTEENTMRGITKVALGFAAATLSLSAGGAIANAQEVPTPPSPTTHTVVHHEPLALAGTIEQHIQNHPTVPAGEILDFLSQSLTLIGRDVLTNTGSNTAHPAQKSDGTTTDGSNEDLSLIHI